MNYKDLISQAYGAIVDTRLSQVIYEVEAEELARKEILNRSQAEFENDQNFPFQYDSLWEEDTFPPDKYAYTGLRPIQFYTHVYFYNMNWEAFKERIFFLIKQLYPLPFTLVMGHRTFRALYSQFVESIRGLPIFNEIDVSEPLNLDPNGTYEYVFSNIFFPIPNVAINIAIVGGEFGEGIGAKRNFSHRYAQNRGKWVFMIDANCGEALDRRLVIRKQPEMINDKGRRLTPKEWNMNATLNNLNNGELLTIRWGEIARLVTTKLRYYYNVGIRNWNQVAMIGVETNEGQATAFGESLALDKFYFVNPGATRGYDPRHARFGEDIYFQFINQGKVFLKRGEFFVGRMQNEASTKNSNFTADPFYISQYTSLFDILEANAVTNIGLGSPLPRISTSTKLLLNFYPALGGAKRAYNVARITRPILDNVSELLIDQEYSMPGDEYQNLLIQCQDAGRVSRSRARSSSPESRTGRFTRNFKSGGIQNFGKYNIAWLKLIYLYLLNQMKGQNRLLYPNTSIVLLNNKGLRQVGAEQDCNQLVQSVTLYEQISQTLSETDADWIYENEVELLPVIPVMEEEEYEDEEEWFALKRRRI